MHVKNTGPVTLNEFRSWSALPGVALAAGDLERLRWCNATFAAFLDKMPDELIGRRYADYLPEDVLRERRELWKPMVERGERVEYDQFFGGRRVQTKCAPLHPEVLGEGLYVYRFLPEDDSARSHRGPVASQNMFAEFGSLSKAELRVLHAFAQGWSREEMARRMFRSPHTIQVHLKNIYSKLGIHREVELALKLGKSGIGGFTPAEWDKMLMASSKGAADEANRPSRP